MPERSPARGNRFEEESRARSVLPPRKNIRPENRFASGCAARNHDKLVSAALRFEASISLDTGMYLVVPLVVPEESAKYGIRVGQVTLSKIGNSPRQYSSQKAS